MKYFVNVVLIILCLSVSCTAPHTDRDTEDAIIDSILVDENVGDELRNYCIDKIIANFYKYRNEDSLSAETENLGCWLCMCSLDTFFVFNFEKGTIKKVKKHYENTLNDDIVPFYVNYIKGFPTERTITGDFNGDGKKETLMVGDIIEQDDYGVGSFYFVFSDKTIPKLKVSSNLDYTIKNEGDLDGDSRDEIGFLYGWGTSTCRSYTVFTLKNNKWKKMIEYVPLTYDMRETGIVPVEKDTEQEGVILIRSAEKDASCMATPYIVEKSLKRK